MTLWSAILLASIVCMALKIIGYWIPRQWLEAARPARVLDLTTIALLAALVAYLALHGPAQSLVVDARVGALAVAFCLLIVRAPFVVIIFAGAATAALLRLVGWMA